MSSDDPDLPDPMSPSLATTTEGRSAVTVRRRVAVPLDAVWDAITRPELLARWFPGAPQIELRAGGRVRFAEFAGDPAEFGEVLAVQEPQRVVFTWDAEVISLVLEEEPDGAVLTLSQTGDDRAGAASYATGWEACLAGLAQVLAGEDVSDPGPRRSRHEELAAAFGLDAPGVEEDGDGWLLRVERQLVVPAPIAWDLLLTGADPEAEGVGTGVVAPPVGAEFRAPRAPEVLLGTVTEVEPGRVLAFDTAPGEPGDAVRLELGEGTGHGARLHLTVRGTDPAEREAAAEHWGAGAVAGLAAAALVVAER